VRAYGKVTPRFWTGPTGRRIRSAGPAAQVLALYLLTGPHANMLGLYYLPLPYIGHETGLDPGTVARAFAALVAGDFCRYDPETEFVWVLEMARYQVGDALSPRDKRVAGVARALARLPENPFKAPFMARYGGPFQLKGAP
jgi:DNA-binding IclR family transcriptional regulator